MTSLLVGTLFSFGYLLQALKKLIGLISKITLNLLSSFGINLLEREKKIIISEEFKNTYKDIKVVKMSNKNLKNKSSIDWWAFGLILLAGLLILLNMKGVFVADHNVISDWLYGLIKNFKIIKSEIDMNTMYTAAMFSTLSFSVSRLLARWKAMKPQRLERREYKLKQRALELMTTKELLDSAKKKDNDNKDKLK